MPARWCRPRCRAGGGRARRRSSRLLLPGQAVPSHAPPRHPVPPAVCWAPRRRPHRRSTRSGPANVRAELEVGTRQQAALSPTGRCVTAPSTAQGHPWGPHHCTQGAAVDTRCPQRGADAQRRRAHGATRRAHASGHTNTRAGRTHRTTAASGAAVRQGAAQPQAARTPPWRGTGKIVLAKRSTVRHVASLRATKCAQVGVVARIAVVLGTRVLQRCQVAMRAAAEDAASRGMMSHFCGSVAVPVPVLVDHVI